ncbi:MAG: ABC transporter ATP-binding protein [Clostridiaceae bacterium]|jgi:ATP-binding cassette subfamily B protein|nr:ABC transporter ATP-binding protein [Clostridiaceae bacterium]
MFRKLLPYVGKYKKYALLAPLTIIIEVFLEVNIPRVMAKLVDVGIANRDFSYILKMGLLMILMAVLSLVLGVFAARFASIAACGFAKGLRQGLFHKIQDFSFANMDKFTTASLVTRLTTDVNNAQMTFMMMIRMMIRAPIMLIMAVFMAVLLNAKLSLVFLFAIPVLGISLYFIASNAFPRFQVMLKKYDRLNAIIQENLIGIRVVKAFVRDEYEEEKFSDVADQVRQTQMKAEKIVVWNMPIMQFVMYGCMIAVSWFGGNLIIAGDMLSGELMGFISYITQILMSLMMITVVFVMFVITRASLVRITEVLNEQEDITEVVGAVNEVADSSVTFENVSFSYGGPKGNLILEGINLSIRSGETIGIIGGTGSAKTTLVQLIPRLYDATGGSVRVGGLDVRDYSLEALRNAVAMVLQKNVLFSGTIRENLKWGDENATEEDIIEACKAAQAHDFIMSFPNGYDTMLGQGGVNVSGGQKQRLCIARALLKKPKIIILDDSTSAVDTETDSKIRKALKEDLKGTTAIIIAQRIASVMDADRIVVMDDGKINGVGTHDELLKENSIYKEVYESQQRGVVENVGT